eukprot:2936804-Pyramimonas_sp.AAC.1
MAGQHVALGQLGLEYPLERASAYQTSTFLARLGQVQVVETVCSEVAPQLLALRGSVHRPTTGGVAVGPESQATVHSRAGPLC